MRDFSLHLGETISSVLVGTAGVGVGAGVDENPTGRDYHLLPTALSSHVRKPRFCQRQTLFGTSYPINPSQQVQHRRV